MFISKKEYKKLISRLEKVEQQVNEDTVHVKGWLFAEPYDEPTLKGKVDAIIKQQRLEIEVKDEKRTVIARKKR